MLTTLALLSAAVVAWCYLQFHARPYYDAGIGTPPPAWFNTVGVRDYTAHWNAVRLAYAGGNPYAPRALCEINPLPIEHTTPCSLLLPPMALLLLAFLWPFSLEWGVAVFAGISLFSALAAAELLRARIDPGSQSRSWLGIQVLLFVPMLEALYFGHFPNLLMLSAALMLIALHRGRDAQAALFALPLTLKPQLFFLTFLLIGAVALLKRRRRFLIFALCGFLALSLAAELIFPGVHRSWIEALPRIGAFSASIRGSTFAGFLRVLFYDGKQLPPAWPSIVLPMIGAAAAVLWFIKRSGEIPWMELVPVSICLSLLFAPYCWGYDMALLIIPLALVSSAAAARAALQPLEARRAVLDIGALHLCLLLMAVIGISPLEQFWWLPAVVLVIWFRNRKLLAHCLR